MDDNIRRLIRQRLQSGRLPRDRTIELWLRPGSGQTCDGCGLAITSADPMSPVVCTNHWRLFRLHAGCFTVWDQERQATNR
jgi:hypothetical protein